MYIYMLLWMWERKCVSWVLFSVCCEKPNNILKLHGLIKLRYILLYIWSVFLGPTVCKLGLGHLFWILWQDTLILCTCISYKVKVIIEVKGQICFLLIFMIFWGQTEKLIGMAFSITPRQASNEPGK